MSSPDDLEQRLKFLDPELSATHSRIDVLETICQANTDRIEALAKHQSKTDRDFVEMSNDLWFHALKVLDGYRTSSETQDVYKLYDFQGPNTILEKHREYVESVYTDKTKIDVKTMYFELIKMMMDQDQGFNKTRDVDQIQGFQELTNRLVINMNDNVTKLNRRLERLENMLDNDRLDQLEQKLNDFENENTDRFGILEQNVADNVTRISNLERESKDHDEQFGKMDEELEALRDQNSNEIMFQEQMSKFQKDTLETLEKRIDSNERHLKLLEDKDEDLEKRLEELEQADVYLQNALKESLTRTEKVETEENILSKDFLGFREDFDRFKEDQDQLHEKVDNRCQTLSEKTEHNKEKLEQLEGLVGGNADVQNEYSIKFVKLENNIQELEDKSDKAEEKLKDHDEKMDNLNFEVKKVVSDTKDNLERLKEDSKIDDRLDNIQNDVNNNKQKIEEANLVIKRHTEQIMEMDEKVTNDVNEIKEELEHAKEGQGSVAKEVGQVQIAIKAGQDRDEALKEDIKENLAKIINLEESNAMQQQQAKFVDALNDRMALEQEQHRQSEAKTKEEMKSKMADDLEQVKKEILEKMHAKNSEIGDEITDLKEKLDDKVDKDDILVKINAQENNLDNLSKDLSSKSSDLQESIDALRSGTDELKKKIGELERGKEELTDEVDSAANRNKKMLDDLGAKMDQLEQLAKDQADKNNKEILDKIANDNVDLLQKIEDANKVIKKHTEDIFELQNKLETDLAEADEKLKESVKGEIEDLVGKVNEKIEEVDIEIKTNAGHVENLRQVNRELIDRLKDNFQDDIENNKGKIGGLENNLEKLIQDLNEIKDKDIKDLVETKDKIEENIKELEAKSEALDSNLKQEQDKIVLIMKESKESHDRMFNQLNEKFVLVKEQENNEIQMLKETIDQLEQKYDKAENDREALNDEIKVVEEKRDSDARFNNEKIIKVETALENRTDDMWNVIMPFYGAFRGYTVRLYSQGDAQKHQSLCLGIYRSIDYHHGRPVYKQDGGQVYLYYMKAEKAWLIGPHIGNNYAWIRNRVESSSPVESSSSSSSSDSDSGSESKRKISSKKNKLGLEIRTPDQLETTWQYRLSIVLGNDEEEQWKDDEKLRVEPLKEVDRLSKVIRRIRAAAKEID